MQIFYYAGKRYLGKKIILSNLELVTLTRASEVTTQSLRLSRSVICTQPCLSKASEQKFCFGTLFVPSVNQVIFLKVTFAFYWNWSQTCSLEETGCKLCPIFNLLRYSCETQMFCYFLSWWWETHWDLHLLCCKAKFSFISTVYFGINSFL